MANPPGRSVPTEPSIARESDTEAPRWLSWSIWGIAALFYLTGFYQRVSPAVMTTELMRDFHIGARDLGNLSAFYFYLYLAMQIPVGVLIDALGARRLLIGGTLAAAAGTFLVAATGSFAAACFGRAVVGAATAVGWLVLLRLSTHWFPSRRFAMLTGLGLCFGNLGALGAQVPLRLAIESYGWRAVVAASAAALLAVGVLAWALVRNDPSDRGFRSWAPPEARARKTGQLGALGAGIRSILGYRNTWLIFFAQGGFVGPMLAFTGLWGAPFLRARFALTPATAAAVCSVMIVCWALASPVFGHLSDHTGRRKPLYLSGAAIAAAGWIAMFYVPQLPLPAFVAVAAVTSLASGAVILGFAFGKESVPARVSGTITGVINSGNMIGPTLLQPGIGWLLDKEWAGTLANGLRVYGIDAFRTAFLLSAGWSVAACLLIAFTRETACRQSE